MSQISGAVPTPEIRGCSLENMKSAQGNKQVLCHSPSLHFIVSLYVEQTLGSLPKQQYLNYLFKIKKKTKSSNVRSISNFLSLDSRGT